MTDSTDQTPAPQQPDQQPPAQQQGQQPPAQPQPEQQPPSGQPQQGQQPSGPPQAAQQPAAAPATGTALTKVNPQIVDAVTTTNAMVIDNATSSGNGIAHQKVAQAAAFAVQDATDYLRNIMTMSATAQGIALKLMIEKKVPTYAQIITQAATAVTQAQQAFAAIGSSAGTVVSGFPQGS